MTYSDQVPRDGALMPGPHTAPGIHPSKVGNPKEEHRLLPDNLAAIGKHRVLI